MKDNHLSISHYCKLKNTKKIFPYCHKHLNFPNHNKPGQTDAYCISTADTINLCTSDSMDPIFLTPFRYICKGKHKPSTNINLNPLFQKDNEFITKFLEARTYSILLDTEFKCLLDLYFSNSS